VESKKNELAAYKVVRSSMTLLGGITGHFTATFWGCGGWSHARMYHHQ